MPRKRKNQKITKKKTRGNSPNRSEARTSQSGDESEPHFLDEPSSPTRSGRAANALKGPARFTKAPAQGGGRSQSSRKSEGSGRASAPAFGARSARPAGSGYVSSNSKNPSATAGRTPTRDSQNGTDRRDGRDAPNNGGRHSSNASQDSQQRSPSNDRPQKSFRGGQNHGGSSKNSKTAHGRNSGSARGDSARGGPVGDRTGAMNLENRVLEGRIDIHPDGFGFLITSDPTQPNIYVGEESLKYCMHRDTVEVRVEGEVFAGQKYRGRVTDIIRRAQKQFIGLYRPYAGGALVVPTEARDRKHAFKVSHNKVEGPLKSGATVLCTITTYPEPKGGTVEIESVIEDPAAASNDTLKVLMAAGWPREFSHAAVVEAEERAAGWKQNLHSERRDIRQIPLVTIDGRDARDFDDAVYAQKEGSNIRLHVAIADVSLFVKPGTVLDREAFERATSVYFPDFVVPMLPEVLSNGVCSLNPNEDRACLVCEAVIGPSGTIVEHLFYEGLMRSHHRLTYDLMQGYIEGEDYAIQELKLVAPHLDVLIDVYKRLRKAREQRGSIDLDLPEAAVSLEKNGEVRDIQSRARLDSNRLIEECMLAANDCAARFLHEKLDQGVYRIHEKPDEKKIKELVEFLKLSGVQLTGSGRKGEGKELLINLDGPEDFNLLLEKVRSQYPPSDPIARAVQTLVLRTLKQAKYSTNRVGHFALATADYTHFTSPIRRYPDLIVHRLIKEALKIERVAGADLERQAIHCSEQERAAMEAERKLIDIKKCRYMEKHLGEEFEAWVNGITEKGLFCQVDGHFVEGLVNSDTIYAKSKHRFDPQTLSYVGPGNSRIRLGSRLKILVAAVTIETRRIDFDLIEILHTS